MKTSNSPDRHDVGSATLPPGWVARNARSATRQGTALARNLLLLGLVIAPAILLTGPAGNGPAAGRALGAAEAASPTTVAGPASGQPQATPVIAQKVTTGDIHLQLVTSGEVEPALGVDLFPKISGQIVQFNVSEGSVVNEGDLVAEIDHRIQDTQLEQAEAALTVAQAAVDLQEVMVKTAQSGVTAARAQADAVRAQVTNLTASRARLEKLHKEGAISRQQLDDVTAQHDAAQAQLVAATSNVNQATDGILSAQMNLKMKQAQLVQAKANLHAVQVTREDAFIKAPFQGIVTRRHLDPGAMANPSQKLLRLEKMNPVKVIGTLVEKNLLLLQPERTEARVRTDSIAEEFIGTVAKIYPAIDPKTRTGQFEVIIDNPERKLRSGMFANIRLFLETAKGAVVVPRDALLAHNGDRAAIRVTPEGIAEKVKVRTGIVQEDRVEILDGLQPGDTIVTQGLEFIRVGAPVKAIIQQEDQP
ncbi:MAG: efflux RND transporter periplasmic adaptor subunit [Candidatus Riflebacteria bacterium]|nr:efflux RND transporter periplasmic adaptor subunit [Candidatus Riflebacteria bacterium]